MLEKEIIEVINMLSWKFAKSMPKNPHWYTVRQKENEQLNGLYETLYNYIVENHYVRYFYGKPYKYCDIGDYSYWIMSDDINVSKIINRALLKGRKDGNDLQREQCV